MDVRAFEPYFAARRIHRLDDATYHPHVLSCWQGFTEGGAPVAVLAEARKAAEGIGRWLLRARTGGTPPQHLAKICNHLQSLANLEDEDVAVEAKVGFLVPYFETLRMLGNVASHVHSARVVAQGDAQIAVLALTRILDWVLANHASGLVVRSGADLLDADGEPDPALLLALEAIDRAVYSDEHAAFRGTASMVLPWYRRNPEIYTLLFHGTTLIGYVNAMPLQRHWYDLVASGEALATDMDIPAEAILPWDVLSNLGGECWVYFCSIGLLPRYQSGEVAKTLKPLRVLLDGYFATLCRWCEEYDIVVRELVADAITEKGRGVAEVSAFLPVLATSHGSVVYKRSVLEAQLNTPSGLRLQHLYRARGSAARTP